LQSRKMATLVMV